MIFSTGKRDLLIPDDRFRERTPRAPAGGSSPVPGFISLLIVQRIHIRDVVKAIYSTAFVATSTLLLWDLKSGVEKLLI